MSKTFEQITKDLVHLLGDRGGGARTTCPYGQRIIKNMGTADMSIELARIYDDAMEALERPVSPWNDNVDAVPEGERVLVTMDLPSRDPKGRRSNYVCVGWRTADGDTLVWCDPESDPQELLPGEVLAWKPLPEPYRP